VTEHQNKREAIMLDDQEFKAPTHLPLGTLHPLLTAAMSRAWRMSPRKKYRSAAPTTIRNVLPITRGLGKTSELGAVAGSIGKDDSTKSM